MTKHLLAAELARILPHAEYVEMPSRKMSPMLDIGVDLWYNTINNV